MEIYIKIEGSGTRANIAAELRQIVEFLISESLTDDEAADIRLELPHLYTQTNEFLEEQS